MTLTNKEVTKFYEVMIDLVHIYYMRDPRPTAKGFLKKLNTDLLEVVEQLLEQQEIPFSCRLSFFAYVKGKENEIKERLTKLLSEFRLMYPVK